MLGHKICRLSRSASLSLVVVALVFVVASRVLRDGEQRYFPRRNTAGVTSHRVPLQHFVAADPSWKAGSFCEEFIGRTFTYSTSLCSNDASRVQCHWANHSRNMGMCVLNDLALAPKDLLSAVQGSDVFSSNSLWLAGDTSKGAGKPCSKPDLRTLERRLEPDDYSKSLVATSMLTVPKRKCQRWINDTSFFYLGTNTHIYFKFLSWYNLHKTLHWNKDNRRHVILRLPQNNQQFNFAEFEELLFPGIAPLDSLGSEVTCFRKVVLVPWAYAATPFRCKMESAELKRKCSECDGKQLTKTDLMTFRTKVLKACSLTDTMMHSSTSRSSILVIERKQYKRHDLDEAKKFQRVWVNSQDLVAALRRQYPTADVTAMHAEDLPICEQIRLAHKADLLIGIHGAGLVHLWWMQRDSVVFELIPPSQHGNAAFRMLAKLLGRKIHSSVNILEKKRHVRVPVSEVMKELKEVFPP